MGEDTADDDALARQCVTGSLHLLLGEAHRDPIATQPGDDLLVHGVLEIAHHTGGYHLSHPLYLHQVFCRGGSQGIDVLEMSGEKPCRRLTHETDTEGEDHAFERHAARGGNAIARGGNAIDNLLR